MNFDQIPPDIRNLILRISLAVLAFGLIWLLRRLLAWLIVRPLRALAQRSDHQADDLLLDVAMLPAQFVVVAIGLAAAAQILTTDQATIEFIDRLARSLLILALFVGLFKAVDVFALSQRRLKQVTGLAVNEQLLPFVRTALKLIVICIALVVIIQEWGYDVSGIITGLGLGGLAFSLAAQDTISNLFGFGMIVSDQPFVVGEYIKTPDVEGIVERVGLRSTRIRQNDQALVTIPNNKLAASAILNWSRLSKRWIDLRLGVSYDANSNDLRMLIERIRSMLSEQPEVEQKSIQVLFYDFSDSALQLLIRCYIFKPDWYEFQLEKQEIYLRLMDIISEMGLSIALPSRSIYIEQMPHPSPRSGNGGTHSIPSAPSPTESPAPYGSSPGDDD